MMPEQKEFNHRKSRVRSRVEHVFGSIANWRTKTEISLKHDVQPVPLRGALTNDGKTVYPLIETRLKFGENVPNSSKIASKWRT